MNNKASRFRRISDAFLRYSRSDRRALLLLATLLLVLIFLNVTFDLWVPKPVESFPGLDSLLAMEQVQASDSLHLCSFDPNEATKNLLDSMGLPERVSANILKYRAAGGIFRRAGDLQKIYGMTDSLYLLLKDYVVVNSEVGSRVSNKEMEKFRQNGNLRKEPKEAVRGSQKLGAAGKLPDRDSTRAKVKRGRVRQEDWGVMGEQSEQQEPLELNAADSSALDALPGIGPVFARRIMKYREILGGFYSINQLYEVYGLPEETVQRIAPRVLVDSNLIRPIAINFATYGELIRHPYLKKEMVKEILEYRSSHGAFTGIEDLEKIPALDQEAIGRMKAYFIFN